MSLIPLPDSEIQEEIYGSDKSAWRTHFLSIAIRTDIFGSPGGWKVKTLLSALSDLMRLVKLENYSEEKESLIKSFRSKLKKLDIGPSVFMNIMYLFNDYYTFNFPVKEVQIQLKEISKWLISETGLADIGTAEGAAWLASQLDPMFQ